MEVEDKKKDFDFDSESDSDSACLSYNSNNNQEAASKETEEWERGRSVRETIKVAAIKSLFLCFSFIHLRFPSTKIDG